MANKILCVAPHPDDETLGCGGTLLRHVANGDEVHWLVATNLTTDMGFSAERIVAREREIRAVAEAYGFQAVHRLGFSTMQLDQVAKSQIIGAVSEVVGSVRPSVLYVPYRNDAHSDHEAVFDAAVACSKSFRYPSVKSVYAYETLSETEFGLRPDGCGFRPNLLVDVSDWLEKKISIMRIYEGEMAEFPFPRSEVCVRSLAQLRGSQAGVKAAEAYMILKEIR